jgi:hypothetical protein
VKEGGEKKEIPFCDVIVAAGYDAFSGCKEDESTGFGPPFFSVLLG